MANNYTEVLALANKNNMGLSNTIKRDYGIPLDYSSIQESYDAALNYAKTSTLAYIGQPISVGDTLYIVTDEAGGYLKAVGTKPTGDNKSITVGDDGKVAMFGFEAAADQTLPQKKPNGTIEWVPIDSIVSGDGNTKTVVTAVDGSDITVTPTYNAENDTYTYTLDVTFPAIPEYSVTKETGTNKVTYKLTKDGTATGEAIEVPNAYDDTALANRVSKTESDIAAHNTRLSDVEDQVNTFFATVENPDEVYDTLSEIQKYIADDKTGATSMASSIKANENAIKILNGESADSVKGQINTAISAKDSEYNSKFETKDTVAAVRAIAEAAAVATDVETALAGKVDNATLESYYQKNETYSRDEINDLVADITGEANSSNTLSGLKTALDNHIADNASSFESIEDITNQLRIDVNKNASDISDINNETTGIFKRAVDAAAIDAKARVEALENGKVATNESAISSLQTRVETTASNITSINGSIGALQEKDTTLTNNLSTLQGAHDALSETVGGHTQSINDLDTRLNAAVSNISSNTAKFDNYSTTSKVETMISEAIAEIDYSAINTKIDNEITRSTEKDTELASLVTAAQNKANLNEGNISKLESTLNAIIEGPGAEVDGVPTALDSIKELAAWVTEHDGAGGVVQQVEANTDAIEELKGDETTDGSVRKTVKDAIAAIPVATATTLGLVKASNEVEVSSTGVMTLGAVSTDKLVQGLNTLILNGGSANITAQV